MAESRESFEVQLDDSALGHAKLGMLHRHPLRTDWPASFTYDPGWLNSRHRFAIDPRLELFRGEQYPPANAPSFGVFLDSAPDRWGRLLMDRREAANAMREKRPVRRLQEVDYLLGVDDETRMGALRFKAPGGPYLAASSTPIPPVASLRELQAVAARLESAGYDALPDEERALALLVAPGSSLGGARPKANFRDQDGSLWLAKFPSREDRHDVERWEYVVHELARAALVDVSPARLVAFGTAATFCAQRFDRVDGARRTYASAMTLLERRDGDRSFSYLEIAEFIASHGRKGRVDHDLAQLFRRVLFNVLVGNRDDHLRNHGFLLARDGWTLAPAFDMNPSLAKAEHALLLDESSSLPSLDAVLATAPYYRVDPAAASSIVGEVKTAVSRWRDVALRQGLPASEIERLAPAFNEAAAA